MDKAGGAISPIQTDQGSRSRRWLFAKKDRANIEADELAGFKKLAQAYGHMTEAQLAVALSEGDLQELSDVE